MNDPRDLVPPGHGEGPVGAIPEAETLRLASPPIIDVSIRTDSELCNAGVAGLTAAGIDFVESINADGIYVVDADRIVVPDHAVPAIKRGARIAGLVVDCYPVARLS